MTWRTHAVAGVASLWLLAPVPGLSLGTLAAVAALGALMPDLDAPGAKISRLEAAGIAPFAPVSLLAGLLGHRRFLHSFLGFAALTAIASWPLGAVFGWQGSAAFAAGYLSHLAMDCCTVSGLPLLWPGKRRFWLLPKGLRVVTGSAAETGVLLLMALAAIALLLSSLGGGATLAP